MRDQVRIKVIVETGFTSKHEDEVFIDRSEWEGMTQEQRDEFLNEAALDLRDNYISCSAWVAKEGEE